MGHGLVERLQAEKRVGLVLCRFAEMLEQPSVPGLPCLGKARPQLLGEVLAEQRV